MGKSTWCNLANLQKIVNKIDIEIFQFSFHYLSELSVELLEQWLLHVAVDKEMLNKYVIYIIM